MIAELERPEETASPATVEDFEVAKVSLEHPQVQAFIRAYFKRMDIPTHAHPLGLRWFALTKGDDIYCVTGAAGRPDGSIEITDIYAKPCKDGIRAVHLALDFFKAMVDAKKIPYFVGVVLWKNARGRRVFEKKFDCTPASAVYIYDGEHRI